MTLASKLLDAGWREFKEGERFVAEKLLSLPGQSASTLTVSSDSEQGLQDAVALRESQLSGRTGDIRDVITNDGTLVTDAQHEALKADGVAVNDAEQVSEPVPNEDEAKQVAGLEDGGFNPDTPHDPTEGSVNAPQVPSDAADQGLSPEAISASETGSGSADTSTQPEARAMPASLPAPEGHDDLPESDAPALNTEGGDVADPAAAPEVNQEDAGQPLPEDGAPAAAASDEAESQSTPSSDVNATPAAVEAADEHGVDLSQVEGSGKDGKVTKPDVEAAASDAPQE